MQALPDWPHYAPPDAEMGEMNGQALPADFTILVNEHAPDELWEQGGGKNSLLYGWGVAAGAGCDEPAMPVSML